MPSKNRKQYSISQLRRFPEIPDIDWDNVKTYPIDPDPIFEDLFAKILRQSTNVTLTRVSTDRILPGHYIKENNKWRHVKRTIKDDLLKYVESKIRSGRRPPLYLYPSPVPCGKDFICSDDEISLKAYSSLKIKKVPAVLLSKEKIDFEETTIAAKLLLIERKFIYAVVSMSRHESQFVKSFIGVDFPSEPLAILKAIKKEITMAANRLKKFHKNFEEPIHYHHTMYSVLMRLEAHVSGLILLLKRRLYLQAQLIVRAMYELVLNFYLDWLMPELFGPILQSSSVFSRKEYLKYRKELYKKWANKYGIPSTTIKLLLTSDEQLYEVATKVSEKARLNPLGPLHRDIYGFLSSAAHEDFHITTEFADLLENPQFRRSKSDIESDILRWTGLLAAQIIYCVKEDCGHLKIKGSKCE